MENSTKANDKSYKYLNRYKRTMLMVSIIHLILVFAFVFIKSQWFIIYNLFVVVLYLILYIKITIKSLNICLLIAEVEICFHSALATYAFGWESGFQLYIIGTIPIQFYMTYSLKRKNKGSYIYGLIAGSIYVGVKLLTSYIGETMFYLSQTTEMAFFTVNTIILIVALFLSSAFFAQSMEEQHEELEESNNQLNYLANHDPLTGLLNRRSMMDHIRKAHNIYIEKGELYYLMIGDIDDFKNINDTYGHDFGDSVLKYVADTINSTIGSEGKVCRWGGEEFLIILNVKDHDVALSKANMVINNISDRSRQLNQMTVLVTMTLGIASCSESASSDKLVVLADKRLYIGKMKGKNCVVHCNDKPDTP